MSRKRKTEYKEGDDPYILFHGRVCVRRGFWLTPNNKKLLQQIGSRFPSDILHKALREFFSLIAKVSKDEIEISCERIDRSKTSITSLYIEVQYDSKISDLAELGFKKQAIINNALSLYLEKR
jgi:hypothetical protein